MKPVLILDPKIKLQKKENSKHEILCQFLTRDALIA